MIADDLRALARPISELAPLPGNARRGDVEAVMRSYDQFGQRKPIVARRDGTVIAGNHQLEAAKRLGWTEIAVVYVDDDDRTAKAFALADNRTGELGSYDYEALQAMLDDVRLDPALYEATGYAPAPIPDLPTSTDPVTEVRDILTPEPRESIRLADRFVMPPFSVLDARSGPWQERKRYWTGLGIRSEIGRGAETGTGSLTFTTGVPRTDEVSLKILGTGRKPLTIESLSGRIPTYYAQKNEAEARLGRALTLEEFERDHLVIPEGIANLTTGGTSVFDPVLTELVYRWFSPPNGLILDPFAGGSVRGIVAGLLGRTYLGIDLRPEQIASNREQWAQIAGVSPQTPATPETTIDDPTALTPVDRVGDIWAKRDDLFAIGGSRGGKVRTCSLIVEEALASGTVPGLITAGSRQSPQVNIVATIARRHGLPCRVHVPSGGMTPEILAAEQSGAEIIRHTPGYNTVIVSRARRDAEESGWLEIPFGMEHHTAITATAAQVANIPEDVRRIVVPVGSGMALAGILHGLRASGRDIPVVGIRVGADPTERLEEYAPTGWRDMVTLITSDLDYHDHAPTTRLGTIDLDPVYEAKCLPYLEAGDLLWIVGRRETTGQITPTTVGSVEWIEGDSREILPAVATPSVDLVFSCPPYADLEVYSDDPRDISTMDWDAFLAAYRDIIRASVAHLAEDRFAVFVVGEVRDRRGNYRNLIGETIRAFVDAGCHYYNEAILVTPVGSLPIRAARQFSAGRKMGKTHQNILVFVKGDGKRAASALGDVETDLPGDWATPEADDDPQE